ncbi:Hint domain-containing protein [Nioella sp.]|uniref:Hint domain-containing protein n=1 Tax=Nioella sp. TaxID=1912091 RepID=UPI003B51BC10
MSDFTYSSFASYSLATGDVGVKRDQPGVITDTDNDNQFEGSDPGGPDPILGNFTLEYWGTLTIGDTTFPVFRDTDFHQPWMFAQAGETLPDSANFALVDFNDTFVFCFAEGTRISVSEGWCAIEDLRIGDFILTADDRLVAVKWIGYQTVSTRFGPAERLMPVRFAAGSLGDGLPTADLTVTADHGMFIDGVICHAGALVNGTTITQVPLEEMGETYTVYHIETEEHEIILAYGAPAETFIDNVSRRAFDNFAEFDALYGDVPEMEELPYPRAMSARQVPGAITRKLQSLCVA